MNDKKYTYYLPESQDESMSREEQTTSTNSLVIIGANGAGKSKLGVWMEEQDLDNTYRVCGLRVLTFKHDISLSNPELAWNMILYGQAKPNPEQPWYKSKQSKYLDGKKTASEVRDFDYVLSAFLAYYHAYNEAFIKEYKENPNNPNLDNWLTPFDKLGKIWREIFQHNIVAHNGKFYCELESGERYSAAEMSDGERGALYLIALVLSYPELREDELKQGKHITLIVDEPELHLHPAIMYKLWSALEKYRPDCLFVYITHDVNFAVMHRVADKIWVKKYLSKDVGKGDGWELEKISNDEGFPEMMLMSILGTAKNILFVEGTESSCDTQLYSILYPDYRVIACGGCEKVKEMTKSFKASRGMHPYDVVGLIDRDFLSDKEIEECERHGVFVLEVAEVENLFVTDEVIRAMAGYLKRIDKVEEIKQEIKKEFLASKEWQIKCNIIKELKHILSEIGLDKSADKEIIKKQLEEQYGKFEEKYCEVEKKFSSVEESHAQILKVFNQKGLLGKVGNKFGLKNYGEHVLRYLQSENEENMPLRKAFERYIPRLPKSKED